MEPAANPFWIRRAAHLPCSAPQATLAAMSRGRTRTAWVLAVIAATCAAASASGRIGVRADPPVLEWSLFRPGESLSSSEDARIAAEMSFPQPLRVERDDSGSYRLPAFTVRVAPNRSQTLVRRSIRPSSELLRHEQGHYDLVVLAARALARDLDTLRADSPREVARVAEDLVAEHTRRADRISERYDHETSHGRQADAQSGWSATIAAALAAPAVAKIAGLPL